MLKNFNNETDDCPARDSQNDQSANMAFSTNPPDQEPDTRCESAS